MMVGGSSSGMNSSSSLSLRVPVERDSNKSDTLPYRVLPLKMDPIIEHLTEDNDNPVPVSPIFAAQLSNDNSEQRLALITSSDSTTNPNQTVIVSGGVLYLISESPSVVSSARSSTFLPRTTDSSSSFGQRMSSSKDEKRRVTHNEVERRRRDKINNWICRLAKVLPDSPDISSKNSSQVSKGVILSKACDHIEDLQMQLKSLNEHFTAREAAAAASSAKLKQELETLKRENDELKSSNAHMKSTLLAHGIVLDS